MTISQNSWQKDISSVWKIYQRAPFHISHNEVSFLLYTEKIGADFFHFYLTWNLEGLEMENLNVCSEYLENNTNFGDDVT